MSQIGWGKNRHFVKNLSKNGGIRELPTPVEDTFELATEKGDKLEAKIEGGEYKDVRYKKNSNTVTFDIFVAKGEKKPFADKAGVIDDEFEYWEQPEDASVPAGIHISRARISCEVKGNTAEGTKYTYTVEPLTPSNKAIDPLQIGTVTVTESNGVISAISFTELDAETDPQYQVIYDGNGATSGTAPVDSNSPYAAGSTVTVLGNTGSLAKTSKTFAGWNTAADGSGTDYAAAATFTINAAITLYAKWSS